MPDLLQPAAQELGIFRLADDGFRVGHFLREHARYALQRSARAEARHSADRLIPSGLRADASYTSRDDVPAEVVEAERQIYLNSDELASKPEQAREKIVDGMLAKRFFAAAPGGVLLEQAWIHDAGATVGKALEEAGASVTAFARVSVAGS